jgi:regulator of nonsense transcripts 3
MQGSNLWMLWALFTKRSTDISSPTPKVYFKFTITDFAGRSSRAMIEFAPFQKYVKGKSKPDARQGTIDTSPEYKEFLDSLSQPVPSEPVVTATEGPTTTPLIEFLRSQKTAKAEKEKANKEKLRLAKIAAVQAKANAQTEKLRAEKMQKGIAAANKTGDVTGSSKQGGGGSGRGSRGGKAPKLKDAQRSNRAQQPQNTDKSVNAPVTVGSSSQAPVVETIASAVATQLPPNTAPTAANGSGAQGFRGRGRGGRARPHGVYRPDTGRGARRGGGAGSNESKPPSGAAEG